QAVETDLHQHSAHGRPGHDRPVQVLAISMHALPISNAKDEPMRSLRVATHRERRPDSSSGADEACAVYVGGALAPQYSKSSDGGVVNQTMILARLAKYRASTVANT